MKEVFKWHPVYTNPKAEKKAHQLLTAKGIESYLPLQKKLKQWSDRKKWVEEPLISSYIFVNIPAKAQTEVLMTKGVCRFLYFCGKVATMPTQQIDSLKLLLASETELEIAGHVFTKGQKVYVKAGPLQGLTGDLVNFHSQKRLVVRIEHINQSILVEIPLAFIEPLGQDVRVFSG